MAKLNCRALESDEKALLRRYRVAYVYVGPLERKTYPAAGLRKFAMHPELFEPVYENPEVKIYRVSGVRADEDMSWKRYAGAMLLFQVFGFLVV